MHFGFEHGSRIYDVIKKVENERDETADSVNAAHYSQGKVAASSTSTLMQPITQNKSAVLDEGTVKSLIN